MMTATDVLIEVTDKMLLELRQTHEVYDSMYTYTKFPVRCVRIETTKKELYFIITSDNKITIFEFICQYKKQN